MEQKRKHPYLIRDYRPEDFNAVERLWQETGLGSAQRGDSAVVIARTLNMGGRLLVIEEKASRSIVATSWLTSDGRRLYLHHFGVRPTLQGQGLARRLLMETLRVCRQIGLQVKLEVHRDNTRAVNLYKNAGFKSLGDYQVYIIRDVGKLTL